MRTTLAVLVFCFASPAVLAAGSTKKPVAKSGGDFCSTFGGYVSGASTGFAGARGDVAAKDGNGAANAWLAKTSLPGAKCWVLANGAMVQCDFESKDAKAGYEDADKKLRSCAKGNDWSDHSIGAGASGGPKTNLAKGKTGVSLEVFEPDAAAKAKGEKPRPRLTIFAPQDDGGLLDE